MPAWIIDRTAAVWSELNGFVPAASLAEPTASSKEPEERWERIFADLREIRKLENDWDGLGAKAPAGELVDSTIELAELLRTWGMRYPSGAVPGVNGTVLLEWQNGGAYLEAEIVRPYFAEWMFVAPDEQASHWVSG